MFRAHGKRSGDWLEMEIIETDDGYRFRSHGQCGKRFDLTFDQLITISDKFDSKSLSDRELRILSTLAMNHFKSRGIGV